MRTNPVLAALLLAIAAGCGKSESVSSSNAPAPPAKVAASGETAPSANGKTVTAEGVSLTFPDDWQTVNMEKDKMEESIKAIEKEPRGKEIAQTARMLGASGMVKLFAVDPKSSKPGFMNNANLIVQSGVGNATLDQALEGSKKQIEAMGATTATSKVSFPAGEFGRMESRMKAPTGAEYVAIGYLHINGGNLNVITFSCGPDQAKAFDAKAQEIMKTYSVK